MSEDQIIPPLDQPVSAAAGQKMRRVGYLMFTGLAFILAGFAARRHFRVAHEEAERAAEAAAGPRVRTVLAKSSPKERTLVLVGEARPYASVTLYAKISGYLSEMLVDKGQEVKKNQVLARIDSPEVAQEFDSATADEKNKHRIAERLKQIFARGLISQQEYDQAISDARIARARRSSATAFKNYEVVKAPFDGTVTARFVDPGALVQNATSSQASAQALVTVSQVDRLRIYIYIDQKDASFAEKGAKVEITLPERPGWWRSAEITRLAGELDPRTRMLLGEIELSNGNHEIVPGSFVQVSFKVKTPSYIEVPVEAVVQSKEKLLVPVVSEEGVVTYREIKAADNDGEKVRVLSGLKEDELVALNLGSSVSDGAHVRKTSSEENRPK